MNGYTLSILLIFFMLALLMLSIRISAFMIRRDICNVVSTFRKHGANDESRAVPLESMKLTAHTPLLSFRLLRDYKPWAIKTLATAGIIRSPREGDYYLSEAKLSETNITCASPVLNGKDLQPKG